VTRILTYAVLLAAMVAFGFGVYHAASLLRSDGSHVVRPSSTTAPPLPGTMYVAQDGALYRFKDGQFTQITSDAGWTQPTASPDGSQLVVVKRVGDYSDLYLLASNGRVEAQLTQHRSKQVEANHWSFYPRFSPDGKWVFYSYDAKDPFQTYKVDLAIFAIAVDGSGVVQWTNPNPYTGGDVDPVPLKSGALLYTKFSIDEKSQVHSQVWIAARPGSPGIALTPPDQNCGAPAVSPDETQIATICRQSQVQSTDVVVASLDTGAYTIGPETTLVTGRLAASPAFSPDGKTIAFLAPVDAGGAFQLWTVAVSASGAQPPTSRPLTQTVGLDATAAPVWVR
jgi:Tol biopolymer transport system component